MREAVTPDALVSAALGFAISFTPPGVARQSALILIGSALAVALIPISGLSDDVAFAGCWISVLAAAATVHIKGGLNRWLAAILAANCGVWAGLVTHVSQGAGALAYALPAVLVFIPGQLLVKRGWGIVLKIAASWLIAISLLEVALNLVPTPGYKPDHMD